MIENIVHAARIFIVDDEPVNLKLLGRFLTTQGYGNIELFQDPHEVLARYQEARPDLILLDLNMPQMNGYEVLAQLRALDDPLLPPVVGLTAQHSRDHLLKALSAGARDFIRKPFDTTELQVRVHNLIEAHLAHRMLHDQAAVLEELVQQRTEVLQQTRLQVVQRLARAAEYRDNETGNHILRMAKVSTLLAESLGWTPAECELMSHASPMHDIGKIGIPDGILLKPGKLEPLEFKIMQTHAEIGAKILDGDDCDLINLARSIALTHHEKWDGTGYPRGLAGAAIPMAGRIVAVADVFDALTSVRPYKDAWPTEKAVNQMKEDAGTHFDPEVIDHFLKCLPNIIEVTLRYAD
ncbi:MAG: response regulator [Gammaproteobacteria bacterium]|nr:response regulator [Gammaproteobacteria bacterium]